MLPLWLITTTWSQSGVTKPSTITAGCSVTEPWAAFVMGLIGGVVYTFSCKMLLMLKIDDPLGASPVHFFAGMWGVFAAGLFATKENNGAFYGADDAGKQVGMQCLGILVIAAWTCGLSGLMFFVLNMFGVLRVPPEDEQVGMDESHHGGKAYDM